MATDAGSEGGSGDVDPQLLIGRKFDAGKDPWDLLPWEAVELIVRVLEFGRKRYGAWNWVGVDQYRRRYFSALVRHLVAWRRGEQLDPDSGLPHLAHAGCCILFLLAKETPGALTKFE